MQDYIDELLERSAEDCSVEDYDDDTLGIDEYGDV